MTHERVFHDLLTTPVSQYPQQLEHYIRYTRSDRHTVLTTWRTLEAYRVIIPLFALPVHRDIFVLNIEIALTILNSVVGGEPKTSEMLGRPHLL